MGTLRALAVWPKQDLLTDLIGVYKQLSQEDTQDTADVWGQGKPWCRAV